MEWIYFILHRPFHNSGQKFLKTNPQKILWNTTHPWKKPMLSTLEGIIIILFMGLCFRKNTLMRGQEVKDLFCNSYTKFYTKSFIETIPSFTNVIWQCVILKFISSSEICVKFYLLSNSNNLSNQRALKWSTLLSTLLSTMGPNYLKNRILQNFLLWIVV